MASARDEIMARSGPEDLFAATLSGHNSSEEFTAGPDYTVSVLRPSAPTSRATESLHYKDIGVAGRYWNTFQSASAAGDVVRDLMRARYICTKPAFSYQTRYAHQEKQCTPVYLELSKCGTKLVRAVDTLCRDQYTAYVLCREGAKGDSSKCLAERTAFDVCTEDF